MSKANEPAFPQTNEQRYQDPVHGAIRPSDIYGDAPAGLTKRELIAAMAMQGLCAGKWGTDKDDDELAKWAVRQADALLCELEKESAG